MSIRSLTLGLLESPKLSRDQVQTIASDTEVLDHVDQLVETLESLRRRLARLASSLR
jgi:Mg2+ and Co2+ transporter CorA